MTRLLPAREIERLDALRRLAIVDSAPEPHFDAICRFACDLFDVPIATIAFLDADRQWFKASCGLDAKETQRNVAFCARTILFDEPLVVPDATADRRFATNPFVAGAPGIRFYAGVPLAVDEGLRIGTVCVIDTAPRSFPPAQLRKLQGIADIAVAYLRLREAARTRADVMAEGRRLIEGLATDDLSPDGRTHLARMEAPLRAGCGAEM